MGLKCLRTSWKRGGGGGERCCDGRKKISDVKHHLLEPDFDLAPVVPEEKGGMCKARWDVMGFGLMSPMGPLFLSLNSLTTKWGPLPQASHPAPAPFFGGKYFCFTFMGAFSPFCLCAAAWPGEEGSHMHLLLDTGAGFSGSFWSRDRLLLVLPEN